MDPMVRKMDNWTDAGGWLLQPKGVQILQGAYREVPHARGMMHYGWTSRAFAIFEVKAAGRVWRPFFHADPQFLR